MLEGNSVSVMNLLVCGQVLGVFCEARDPSGHCWDGHCSLPGVQVQVLCLEQRKPRWDGVTAPNIQVPKKLHTAALNPLSGHSKTAGNLLIFYAFSHLCTPSPLAFQVSSFLLQIAPSPNNKTKESNANNNRCNFCFLPYKTANIHSNTKINISRKYPIRNVSFLSASPT